MRIAILEWVTGGGLCEQELPQSLAQEGMAMLKSASRLLMRSGYQVEVCIDTRCVDAFQQETWSDACQIHQVGSHSDGPVPNRWLDVAKGCDRCLVIAPELNGILKDCCDELSRVCSLLNCRSDFLENASDKLKTSRRINATGQQIFHPPTCLLSEFTENWAKQASMECAASGVQSEEDVFILKRNDGAGCEEQRSVSLPDACSAREALSELDQSLIVQPKMLGTPCSISFLFDEAGNCSSSPIALQHFSDQGLYRGGTLTTEWPSDELRQSVVNCIDSLGAGQLGWIGVDFLRQKNREVEKGLKDKWIIIEFNPRLTTSIVGIAEISKLSLGNLLACRGSLPERFPISTQELAFSADGTILS